MITVWQRERKDSKGQLVWEHNHIEIGYDEKQEKPSSVIETQRRGWEGSVWRKQKAMLINGVITPCE